jgi:hypothetical protein
MCQVIEFPAEVRAAHEAARLCREYQYGLTATQALQKETVRFMQRTGVSAYEAAARIVRGPREPFFGNGGWAA